MLTVKEQEHQGHITEALLSSWCVGCQESACGSWGKFHPRLCPSSHQPPSEGLASAVHPPADNILGEAGLSDDSVPLGKLEPQVR